MNVNTPNSTPSGQLPHAQKGSRKLVALRLERPDYKELSDQANTEVRSMSFIALRRYLKGRELEIKEANQ